MKPEHQEISKAVLTFVHINLHVPDWALLSKSRRGFLPAARACAAVLMRGCGMSHGQIAEALRLQSRSSIHELIASYSERRWLRSAAEEFGIQESRFEASKAFGNSSEIQAAQSGGAG